MLRSAGSHTTSSSPACGRLNERLVHMQMMQQAQAMMANMTPEQMASMQQMVQNMSPEQRANMERMAQQQMGGGAGAAGASASTPSGQAQYKLGGARMLKDEGNALHKAGRHSEALAKYETAISNVSGLSSIEAVELKTSCELNKAMCHLKLEQWAPCEQVCSAVLTRAFLLSPCTASATNHARVSRSFLLLLSRDKSTSTVIHMLRRSARERHSWCSCRRLKPEGIL